MSAVLRGALVVAVVAAGLASGAGSAGALGTFSPSTTADDGTPGSLRRTLNTAAGSGDDAEVVLQGGATYVIDRLCQAGDLDNNVGGDLDWGGPHPLTIRSSNTQLATIEVQCVGERVFDHWGMELVTFERIRLTGGNLPKAPSGDPNGDRTGRPGQGGGAVRANGAPLQFNQSEIVGNRAGDGGNGAPSPIANDVGGGGGVGGPGGAVQSDAKVGLSATLVADNVGGGGGRGGNGTGSFAGGVGGVGGSGGLSVSDLTLVRSTVRDNQGGAGGTGGSGGPLGGVGGAGGSGGVGGAAGAFGFVGASVLANQGGQGGAGGTGGGGGAGGAAGRGGVGGAGAVAGLISTSTVHGNIAGTPGAGGAGSPVGAGSTMGVGGVLLLFGGEVTFSTITANRGAPANLDGLPATIGVTASVIGEPLGGPSCDGAMTSEGWNVSSDNSCALADPTDVITGDLGLGPLDELGVRFPELDGLLHDHIPAADCAGAPLFDGLGSARPLGDCEPGAIELGPRGASRLVPLPPQRVFDTRNLAVPSGFVGPGQTITVDFTGVAGVPANGVSAVAFNLTLDAAGGEGFVTAWPGGQPRPLASNLNTVRAGQTVPNMVVVPVGPGGTVSFYTQSGGHLLADIAGYFEEVVATDAGRVVAVAPQRLFDTRNAAAPSGFVGPGQEIAVKALGVAGLPTSGVQALIVNVTATEAGAAGFVTGWPGGTARPNSSILNLTGPGHTAPNLAILPVGSDGTIRFYTQSGAHLLADVLGYVTDGSVDVSTGGLVVPLDPARVFDTRTPAAPAGFVGAAGEITVQVTGVAGVPDYPGALFLNVTATQGAGAGFVTGWPASLPQPNSSILNLTQVGETRANAALLLPSGGGELKFLTQSGAHLLADVFGYVLLPPGS